jgi:bifunctional enzyme Fae/Hps
MKMYMNKTISKLSSRKRYLQIALNSTLEEAKRIITQLPISDRILIEAGTPLIKRYGEKGIRKIKQWYEQHIFGQFFESIENPSKTSLLSLLLKGITKDYSKIRPPQKQLPSSKIVPYVVADLKMMDRGETEVEIAARAGADAVIALGCSPIESLNSFIQKCEELRLDAMVDMMNVEFPLSILRQLKKLPRVVILHRGVDEERYNKEKQIPFHEIQRIKGNYDILISIAGGDTIREVQRAVFNDADIVVVWKSFFQSTSDTAKLAEEFLKEVK